MTKLMCLALVVLCVAGALAAQEGQPNSKMAKYIYFEDAKVNSGKFSVFAKQMTELREAAATAAPDSYWIAGSPITGDSSAITFVTFQDSMAGVENFMAAMDKIGAAARAKDVSWEQEDAESAGGANMDLAKYNEELSLRPDAVPLAETAYWSSEVFELRPGCSHQFEEAVKTVMDLHKKGGDNAHWVAYDLMSGPSLPAVLFVRPMKSLAEEDQEPPAAAKELFQSAMVRQMISSTGRECITHISESFHKMEPGLSRPMPALVSANPSFWTVKEETVSTAPMKAKMKKSKKKKM